jgi:hypothetical protein
MPLGSRRQAHPTEAVGNDNIMVNVQRLTATGQSIHFAPTHPGSDTFLYEVGF